MSSFLKFNKIYKKILVTFVSPNKSTIKIYLMINLMILITYYKYYRNFYTYLVTFGYI